MNRSSSSGVARRISVILPRISGFARAPTFDFGGRANKPSIKIATITNNFISTSSKLCFSLERSNVTKLAKCIKSSKPASANSQVITITMTISCRVTAYGHLIYRLNPVNQARSQSRWLVPPSIGMARWLHQSEPLPKTRSEVQNVVNKDKRCSAQLSRIRQQK